MAPGQPYFGPIGMAGSRYASPHRRRQVEALMASHPEIKVKLDTGNILANKEQIAAANNTVQSQSTGVQLAHAQGQALKQEAAQHNRILDQKIATVAARSRQVLNLICDTIKQERPATAEASFQVSRDLQHELHRLIEAIRVAQAQNALPCLLEKQRENVGLLANTKIQEAHLGIQQKLDQKDQKAKLGQELVFEQQQAYKNVEADANTKNTELHDRLSRAHMAPGLLKAELDAANAQLEQARVDQQDAAKVRGESDKKLSMLKDSRDSLSTENNNIRLTIKDLEAKLKTAEEAIEHYEKKVRNLTDQLQKEQQKVTALDTHLNALRQADETSKREAEKAKIELKLLSEKYNNQSGAYARMSEDLKEQTRQANTLGGENRSLQQQNAELEKERVRAVFLKDSLRKQHAALKSEFDDLKHNTVLAKENIKQTSEKLKRAEKEKSELETEINKYRAKQLEHDEAASTLQKANAEIATLRATLKTLKNHPATVEQSSELVVLYKEIQDLKEKFAQSEASRAEWEDLGRKAMHQYREIKPRYKQLEGIEKQLEQVLAENEQLKGKATGSTIDDAKYWRNKYNELLAEMES